MSLVPDFEVVLEESEVSEVRSAERTALLYPTSAPDGRTWGEYFKEMRAKDRAARAEVKEAPTAEVEVIEPWFEHPTPPGSAGSTAKRLRMCQWDVSVRASVVLVPAVLYVSDSAEDAKNEYRAGDVRFAAHHLETFVLVASKRGANGKVGLACEVTWERKEGKSFSFIAAKTFDPILGPEWRTSSTKPRPPRDWEIEEDVPPPLGFGQWLDLTAPKPNAAGKKGAKG